MQITYLWMEKLLLCKQEACGKFRLAVKREDLLRFYMVDVILYTHEVKQIQILMTRNGKIFWEAQKL